MYTEPTVQRGNDGKLYLVFQDSSMAELFLESLGASKGTILHCCGGHENAIEIIESFPQSI